MSGNEMKKRILAGLSIFFVSILAHADETVSNHPLDDVPDDLIFGGLESPDNPADFLVRRRSGIKVTSEQAARWLKIKAEQGNPYAQVTLGFAYMRGIHVPHDDAKARHWHQKAARAGIATGHGNMAYLYLTGRGGPKSYLLAYKHYFIAAFTVDPETSYLAGRWYEREAEAKNLPLTLIYYFSAARRGHPQAIVELSRYMLPIIVILFVVVVILARAFWRARNKNQGYEKARHCLSSQWTPLFKFVVSAAWFCILVAGVLLVWLGVLDDFVVKDMLFAHDRWIGTLSGMAMSLLFGVQCVLLKRVDLDFLHFHISNYLRQVQVPVQSLVRVSCSRMMWPEFIAIDFTDDTGLGKRIVFIPTLRLVTWFTPHPTLEQLRKLIEIINNKTDMPDIPGNLKIGEVCPNQQTQSIAGKPGAN